jgi:type II secretory pathway component GspD/PulD (secretin)
VTKALTIPLSALLCLLWAAFGLARLPAQTAGEGQASEAVAGPNDPLPPPVPAPTAEAEITIATPPVPTPPLRTADVAFPTPSSGGPANEPLVAIGRPVERANYGSSGNRRAMQLRSMPPETFTFDRASLRDVLRLLAEQAGIPYIGIPEHSPVAQRLVTFRMTASPFTALESVARQNDIRIRYEDGVWFMGLRDANLERTQKIEDENELVGVVYQLKHDPVDRVDFRQGGGGQAGGSMSASDTLGTITSPNLPLQYSQRVFESKAPRIVNEIRIMLGMRPVEYKADGTFSDPEVTTGTEVPREVLPPFDGTATATARAGDAAAAVREGAGVSPVYIPPQRPQVIYNSDTNVLWVVATRKQHRWVAEYLQRVDKPQDLIAIEVKFFETRMNPKTDLGINWANTFGTGLTVGGRASIGNADGQIGAINFQNSRQRGENRGNIVATLDENGNPGFEAEPTGTIDNNIRGSSVTGNVPYSAILSLDEFSFTMQAFMEDRDSSLVQYPRVLTINNREVAITSAENTPVNAGVQTVQSGGTSSQPVGTLEYVPVGTQINILPKAVGKNQIALTVAVTISQIVDFVRLNLGTGENAYPVTTQRVYNASLQVDSGYTLAVGGLEKTADRNVSGGVPLLQNIPGLGYLFKNKSRARDKSNLIIFITPYLISDPSRTPGISETPEAVIPLRPGQPPPAPNFDPEGRLVGGQAAVPRALAWADFQLRYFRQINIEARDDEKSISELRAVIQRVRMLCDWLQPQVPVGTEEMVPGPIFEQAARAEVLLVELNKVQAQAQMDNELLKLGIP